MFTGNKHYCLICIVIHRPTQEVAEDSFIGSWWTLNFHVPVEGLNQMGGLKFFTLLWGNKEVISTG